MILKNQAWLDKQKKNLTVTQSQFAVALCFYPCGWDDLEAVELYANLFGKVRTLQNKIIHKAAWWRTNMAELAVHEAWQKVQDHDAGKGWPVRSWEDQFGKMTQMQIMENLIDSMLATAYEIDGISDE